MKTQHFPAPHATKMSPWMYVVLYFLCMFVSAPAFAGELLIGDDLRDRIYGYGSTDGAYRYTLGATADTINNPIGMARGRDGLLYVACFDTDRILRYNLKEKRFVDALITGINQPRDILFDANGSLLILTSTQVKRYNPATGTATDILVSNFPKDAQDMEIGPDGKLYIASIYTGYDDIRRYNLATGVFEQRVVSGLNNPYGFTFGPDGNLYVSDTGNDQVKVYNGMTGGFIRVYALGRATSDPKRLSFGPDGDLYLIDDNMDEILQFQGPRKAQPGTFVRALVGNNQSVNGSMSEPRSLLFINDNAPADFNGDGYTDILFHNQVTGELSCWFMRGSLRIGNANLTPGVVPAVWQVIGTPDLNRDDKCDILWQNQTTGAVVYWLMNGTRQVGVGTIVSSVPAEWRVAGTADLNGDGKADLLWRNLKTGGVVYWLMDGVRQVSVGSCTPSSVPLDWNLKATPDLNGDGKADILWQNRTSGAVVYWLMDGVRQIGYGTIISSVPTGWNVTAQMNATDDTFTDLVWQNQNNGDIVCWAMNGTRWTGNYVTLAKGIPTAWKIVSPR